MLAEPGLYTLEGGERVRVDATGRLYLLRGSQVFRPVWSVRELRSGLRQGRLPRRQKRFPKSPAVLARSLEPVQVVGQREGWFLVVDPEGRRTKMAPRTLLRPLTPAEERTWRRLRQQLGLAALLAPAADRVADLALGGPATARFDPTCEAFVADVRGRRVARPTLSGLEAAVLCHLVRETHPWAVNQEDGVRAAVPVQPELVYGHLPVFPTRAAARHYAAERATLQGIHALWERFSKRCRFRRPDPLT
jgi:hypothetical protein